MYDSAKARSTITWPAETLARSLNPNERERKDTEIISTRTDRKTSTMDDALIEMERTVYRRYMDPATKSTKRLMTTERRIIPTRLHTVEASERDSEQIQLTTIILAIK